jgi:hypothetical protein
LASFHVAHNAIELYFVPTGPVEPAGLIFLVLAIIGRIYRRRLKADAYADTVAPV